MEEVILAQLGVGLRVCRVEFDRLFKKLLGTAHRFRVDLQNLVPCPQKSLIGSQIRQVWASGGFADQLDFQRVSNGGRDLVLNREDVLHLAVVTLGPEMVAVLRVHELRGALQHDKQIKTIRDLVHVGMRMIIESRKEMAEIRKELRVLTKNIERLTSPRGPNGHGKRKLDLP